VEAIDNMIIKWDSHHQSGCEVKESENMNGVISLEKWPYPSGIFHECRK
jgi:hypothetical protein